MWGEMGFVVTGGAGFIGSHLTNRLASLGANVRVIDDGSTGLLGHLNESVEVAEIDISSFSEEDWAGYLRPSDTVFHLAARKFNTPGVTDEDLLATNLGSTISLARAGRNVGISKIVFSSSLYVYGHLYQGLTNEASLPLPQTLYGMSKLAGEHSLTAILESSDIVWSSARLFFTYGPKQFPGSGYKSVIVKNFERIRDGLEPLICGSGEQSLDYIYVDDVIEALILLGREAAPGSIYNVSSGTASTIQHLTGLMLEVSGRSDLSPLFIEPDWTDGTLRGGENSKLQDELGWSPKISLRDGLERTWRDMTSMTGG